jgi:hypothetical protein
MAARWRNKIPENCSEAHISYFRDFDGRLFGCLSTVHVGGIAYMGAACCHPGDQFNRKIGRAMATGRALKAVAMGYKTSDEEFLANKGMSKVVICPSERGRLLIKSIRIAEKDGKAFGALEKLFENPDSYEV